jgi:hypothetical protein
MEPSLRRSHQMELVRAKTALETIGGRTIGPPKPVTTGSPLRKP